MPRLVRLAMYRASASTSTICTGLSKNIPKQWIALGNERCYATIRSTSHKSLPFSHHKLFSTSSASSSNTSNPAASAPANTDPSPSTSSCSPTSSTSTTTNDTSQSTSAPTSNEDSNTSDRQPRQKKKSQGPLSWRAFIATTIVGIIGLVAYRRAEDRQQREMNKGETYGRIAIGGPYDLIDENGNQVTSDTFKDKYQLIYFGFTNCPDICPTEMKKMEEVLRMYEQLPMHKTHPVIPIFITIDPRRDTPARLQEYRKGYMPEFVWLTGSDEQVKKVAKSYRVFYSAPENLAENEDYLMEHTIFFYLANRDNEVVDYYGKILTANEIFKRLVKTIKEDSRSK